MVETTMQQQLPLSLSDEQLELVRTGAEPIRPAERDWYLRAFVEALGREKPVTTAAVRHAVREAQHEVLHGRWRAG